MLPEPDQAKVRIGIRWHTGATDELRVARAIHPGTARRSPSPAVEMVRQLGPVTPTAELAGQLNAAGLTTGDGRPFDVKAVQWIRHAYKIPAPDAYADGEISVAEAARRLDCSTSIIYYWIHTGQLTARRSSGNRLCIPWDSHIQAGCQERIAGSSRLGRSARPRTLPAPPSPAAEGEVSVTEAAYQLGCSIGVIYDWIDTGKLAARRGAGNRLHIPWNEHVQAQCRARIEQSGHLNPAARKTRPRRPHRGPGNVSASRHPGTISARPAQRRSQNTKVRPARDCRRGSMNRPSQRGGQVSAQRGRARLLDAYYEPQFPGFLWFPARRGSHDARLRGVAGALDREYNLVYRRGHSDFFGSLDHGIIVDILAETIQITRVLGLCGKCFWPRYAVEDGIWQARARGAPQGSASRPQRKRQFLLRGHAGLPACGAGPVSAAVPAGPLESDPGGFVPQAERAAILAGVLDGVELGAWDRRVAGGWPGWTPRRC